MSGTKGRVVLIAMDGSIFSEHALDWYVKSVRKPDDDVVVIFCPEYTSMHSPVAMTDPHIISELIAVDEKSTKAVADNIRKKIDSTGISIRLKVQHGSPGDVITKVADQEKAAFIVTGNRGTGKLRRTFVGSVSDYVMHHSHVPVLVWKHRSVGHHHHHHEHQIDN